MIINEQVGGSKKSVRQLATRIKRSKSSVHRHRQAQAWRNQYPESAFWETEAGEAWLQRLMAAVLYCFGLECHVGADKLSRFFELIRIDTHVGISPSTLRRQLSRMETLLPLFQQQSEKEAADRSRSAVVAMDETFLGDEMILVLLDLSSGYLILEELSQDRRFDTWFEKAIPRLKALGIDVNHAVSDRAKALIKLAVDGFECASGADVFHAQQDVSRWLGTTLGRRHEHAKSQFETAEALLQQKPDDNLAELVKVVDAERDYESIRDARADYHQNLAGIAEDVHPFSLQTQGIQQVKQVTTRLEQRAQAFEALATTQAIADSKQTIKKFRNQLNDLAANVEAWWLLVMETLAGLAVNKVTQHWLIHVLLPTVYWHQQLHKTQNAKQREKYRQAWQRAVQHFHADAFTASLPASEVQRWLEWAEWMARQFHRSSSAVEGRNGYLSQMIHNGRGLSEKRLRALTVIHNYGLKHVDGTTAAMRLFGRNFPDLFSWLLTQMDTLPLPRKGRQRMNHNPLILQTVPA